MTAVLFWEWMQGTDRVRPLSRVVESIRKAVNEDRDRVKGVDLQLTEMDVHDAFEEAQEDSPLEVNAEHPLNDEYILIIHRSLDSLYGVMRVERPWGKTTRILGEGWWFSLEVSV